MIEYEFITRAQDLPRVAEAVARSPVVGLDIETTSLDPRNGEIRLVQFNVPGEGNGGLGRVFVVDLFETKGLGPLHDVLRRGEGTIFVIHNAKFEQKWFWWKHRIRLWPIFCTFRSSAILYNGKKGISHDLVSVAMREINEHPKRTQEGASDWSGRLSQDQKEYASEDVLYLPRLRDALKDKLREYGLLHTALIEFGVVFAECRVELSGFHLDQEKWKSLAEANRTERDRLREELLDELPHPKGQLALPGMTAGWNLDSPQQVLASLKRMGLKIESTPEIVLAQFAAKSKKVRKLLDYRHASQLVKTFGEQYLRHIRPDTGRVHSEYFGLLLTGRYASSKPNLQQIPRDRDFRACFTAPPGRALVLADYAGIEMRLCAEISGDKALTQVFLDGKDAHYATAAIIMAKAESEVTKAERQNAKPVNFGFIYGMMPDKFILYAMANYGVVVTLTESKKYRERYFEKYKGVEHWHRRVLRDGQRMGMSRTLSGRLRYLDPAEAYNEFYNTPVQGSGADGLKTSLAIVQDKIDSTFGVSPAGEMDGPVRIVHHVHDEILVETDDDSRVIEVAEKVLHDGMFEGMSKFMTKVPVVVEPSHGGSWASAKG